MDLKKSLFILLVLLVPFTTAQAGDVNEDLIVDLDDLVFMTVNLGDSGFDPVADINGDGRVNIFDLVVVARNYGNDYSQQGPVCGDNNCDLNESCSSCSQDCGSCSNVQPVFFDGFESGDLNGVVGGNWYGNQGGSVTLDNSYSGSYSLQVRYPANVPWREIRANVDTKAQEGWLEYYLYVPDNWEYLGMRPPNNSPHHKFAAFHQNNDYVARCSGPGCWTILMKLTGTSPPTDVVPPGVNYGNEQSYTDGIGGAQSNSAGQTGPAMSDAIIDNEAIKTNYIGTWVRVRYHLKLANFIEDSDGDGIFEGNAEFHWYMNDDLIVSAENYPIGGLSFSNPIDGFVVLGDNAPEYDEITYWYVDDVAYYTQDPGWFSSQTCSDGDTRQCGSSDVGACEFGVETCNNNAWGICVGNVEPVPEVCEGNFDENCDGQIDEGCISCSCSSWVNNTCGAGSCSSTEMQQTRSCTPSACQVETQCVSDASCQAPSSFDDEFNDPASLSDWTQFTIGENSANYYELLDVDTTVSGHLVLTPGPGHSGWYSDEEGPFLYKLIGGDFLVSTYASANNKNDLGSAPTRNYNSAGLLVRDPASTSDVENFVMTNLGHQNGQLGSETKTTINSQSSLDVDPGSGEGELRICRIGDDFRFYRLLTSDSDWFLMNSFTRSDFPQTLQVGLVVNGWQSPPDIRAEFDWFRHSVPTDWNDCTS